MDVCLLCLQIKQESIDIIRVTSIQWRDENIEKLIEKHFWPLESINQHSWLCYTCWDMLREFHRFYLNVEESHIHFETTLKIEPPENTETRRRTPNNVEAKSKDETMGIVVDDMSLAIKSETNIEESAMLDTTVVRCSSKPTTPQECSDPLDNSLPVKARTIIRGNKSCKVRRKCVKEVTPKEYTMRDDENETIGDGNSSSTEFPLADNKNSSDSDGLEQEETSIISHCKSKTKRNEFDEFLATNFNMTCSICTAPMPTFNELCKHFVKEHKVRGFVSCCNKKFFRRSVLVDHIHRHLNPEYFKCKDCGKIMADRRCLDLHVKIHESQEKTHFCDVCGKAFSRLSAVKNHKLLLHLSDEEKKFACDQCGKLFGNKNLLANHVRVIHLNKYALVCDICGSKMRSREVFERHILKHKGVPLPTISCDICGLKMTDHGGLKRHKETQHPEGGKKDYPCHLCTKISPTLKAHKRHVQYKHELGYNFKCNICDKAFKRSCALTEHMATHTGTVLYTCPYCPKTFNSNANMHSHRKKIHPKEWEQACREKYSGNLPPNYKKPNPTTVKS